MLLWIQTFSDSYRQDQRKEESDTCQSFHYTWYIISERSGSERLFDRIEWNGAPLRRFLPILSIAAQPHLTNFKHGARRRVLWLLTLYGVSRIRTSSGPQPVPNCGAFSGSENQHFVKVSQQLKSYRVSLCAKQLQQKLTFHHTRVSRIMRNKPHRNSESWVIGYSVEIRILNQIGAVYFDGFCLPLLLLVSRQPRTASQGFCRGGGAVGTGGECCPIMSFSFHGPV